MHGAKWKDRHARAIAQGIITDAKKINPLDQAVAKKREADQKANVAWRAKLAALAAQKRKNMIAKIAPRPVKTKSVRSLQTTAYNQGARQQTLAAPFPLAPFPIPPEKKESKIIEEEEGKMDPSLGENNSKKAVQPIPPNKRDSSPADEKCENRNAKISPIQADVLLKYYMK